MAWASSGGYPGVVSDGANNLLVPGRLTTSWVLVSPSGTLQVRGSGGSILFHVEAGSNNDGGVFKHGLGLFDHSPPAAPTAGGAATAGGTYTATEEAMLNAAYTALRSIGLVT